MEKNRLAISVDIEDWYHIPAVTGSSFSEFSDVEEFYENWDGEYDFLTAPTHRTLEILEEMNIKATFFIVAEIVNHYPGLVEEIASKGHEVACHGLNHECVIDPKTKEPRIKREKFKNQVSKAKRILEEASEQEVNGYRAPNGYVAGWMLDILEEVGFNYDSSVARCSLYNKTDQDLNKIGTGPYIPKKGKLDPGGDRDFVEIPWPFWEIGPIRLPTAGGPLVRFLGRRIIGAGLKQSLKRDDSMFYFHPIDISRKKFPKIGNMKKRPRYWIFKGEVAEKRIKNLLKTFEDYLATCSDVAENID